MIKRPLRVAVVGSGPSGMYATGHLVEHPAGTWINGSLERIAPGPVEVDVFDRLPTPWGLVRNGVAPDHQAKKKIAGVFDAISARPGVRFYGNVEIGRDVSVGELMAWYDGVVFAVGASAGRALQVPGSELTGCYTAHEFVAWCNGHPDLDRLDPDLSGRTAVVIGNGNVALDVARILSLSPERLSRTDMGSNAWTRLVASRIREVVVVGRRGPMEAAFTNPELEEILGLPDVEIRVIAPRHTGEGLDGPEGRRRARLLERAERRSGADCERRITLLFDHSPVRIDGVGQAASVVLAGRDGSERRLEASFVVAAIGYASAPIPGLPFEHERLVIPSTDGRVSGMSRAYVTGWAKRGPSGVIGTNKWCARETVRALFADARLGLLHAAPTLTSGEVDNLLAERCPSRVTWDGWRCIDRYEHARGREEGRPKVKLTSATELLRVASDDE